MRDDAAWAADIIETCDQLMGHIAGRPERFEADPVLQAAAQRWLEIIGEAAARLSDAFKAEHPDVAWRDLSACATSSPTATSMWTATSCGPRSSVTFRSFGTHWSHD